MAAEVIEELRAKLGSLPDCTDQQRSLDTCFDRLDASLADVSPDDLKIRDGAFSALLSAMEEFKLNSRRASEIVMKISKNRNLLTATSQQTEQETSTSAESEHKELVARLEQECVEIQKAMEDDVEKLRADKFRIDEEFKKLKAEITAIHRREMSSSRESFKATLQQIQETKNHEICKLRLKTLEAEGSQRIQRLDAEIEAVRKQTKETRKLVAKQNKETLLSSYSASRSGLRVNAKRSKRAPGSNQTTVASTDAASDSVVKRPRRELFREEGEEEPEGDNGMIVTALDGEGLEEYIQSLKELVGELKTRRPQDVDPETPV